MEIKFLLIVFAVAFVIALLIHANKQKDKVVQYNPPQEPAKPQKQRMKKVKPYRKWEKKMQHKAGKRAMEKAEFVHLTIEEASDLFLNNSSADEMRLLDIMLEAKLDGVDTVKVDRHLYNKLFLEKEIHTNKI